MNGQKKGDKKIHSDPQNTTQKIEQHEPHKKMSEHRCYGRVRKYIIKLFSRLYCVHA
jgi:hypothetical protein